ncbi:epidermal growth factor receptor kinase substrate 8-like protein 1a isoform X1 [Electrophorus electricus]|uniref:epidermal growth factor receptor kinase substrate 8-like protein 1a isoform X1 n=2 Tax=Electrophorus electricus TaxID=8005 RepID=UPI0015D0C58C|nr:epidermal growth factor receptor kinase substrate 8-like protein 1a isoform X1 [Electrophorus electricus]
MATPQVLPRKHSLIKVFPPQSPNRKGTLVVSAKRDVELLNHCFADVEQLMAQLQRAAEAQNEQKKKKSKKKKKEYDLMIDRESPPSEPAFVDIYQKMKYSLILLDRLKMAIEPSSEELLHHLFVPLGLMVKATGGPALGAGVSSPALSSGAVSLLQQNLTRAEKELWSSLGPNWTEPQSEPPSHDSKAVPLYKPVFLDGWEPEACDTHDQSIQDTPGFPTQQMDEHEDSASSVITGQLYCCSYDFVARNSSELSVLHGETLQVIDSSKRWWKCRNTYDEIGFVPSNILEPIDHKETDSSIEMYKLSKKAPLSPPGGGRFSYAEASSSGENHTKPRPVSMPPMGNDGGRVMLMNNELAQRLANGRPGSVRPLVINRASETSAPLNYHSPPAEVQDWLRGKGFSDVTVNNLGILSGAQLFSLNKEELCTVSPLEGARVYSQIMVQKATLEKVRKSSELENVMKKQKMKVDLKVDSGEF